MTVGVEVAVEDAVLALAYELANSLPTRLLTLSQSALRSPRSRLELVSASRSLTLKSRLRLRLELALLTRWGSRSELESGR